MCGQDHRPGPARRGAARCGKAHRRGDRPPGGDVRRDQRAGAGPGTAVRRVRGRGVRGRAAGRLGRGDAHGRGTRRPVRALPGRAAGPLRHARALTGTLIPGALSPEPTPRARNGGTLAEAGMLFPTSLVGSYPQPDWLIDRGRLRDRFPPRVRARELWRVDQAHLAEAQRDATLLAIRAQEQAGLDILTDGEMCRESYSNRFATALDGVDIDNPGTALDRSGHPNPVPRVTGPIRRKHAVEAGDVTFLRANTGKTIKITVPGPFTMAQQAQNDHYASTEDLALGYAEAVNEEVRDLFAAGADIVQLDEPYLQARPDEARKYGVAAINRALAGIRGTTAVHLCFGYAAIIHDRPSGYSFLPELAACLADQISIETAQSGLDCAVLADLAAAGKTIILGVLNLGDPAPETPEQVVARVRRALPYIPSDQLVLAPDCGMKYLPRESARAKLAAMTAAAAALRTTG